MKPLEIRNIRIGEGIPKICVPIVGKTKEEILGEAGKLSEVPADIAEWRADWYEDVFDVEKVKEVLKELRAILNETPLLFTIRTAKEGGEKDITPEMYAMLNSEAAKTKDADLIDVEAFLDADLVPGLIEEIHRCHGKVIASNHDFEKTPKKDEIVRRLCAMQEAGADILKIAVMPQSKGDAMTLMEATVEMHEKYADRPIVSMSMGGIGGISRICGEMSGSAMTFGTAGKASAPGQMNARDLSKILKVLHENM